jgi:hypothetical protein
VISGLGVAVLQRSPTVSVLSFLQLKVNSFGTSSVQFACFYVNGDVQEFSSIVGGIILGYSISESQYDCTHFVAEAAVNNSTTSANSTSIASENSLGFDLSDDIGLAIEYVIVCIYIIISYIAAYKAFRLHIQQRTRTEFKTTINLSFVVLFLVWATGTLVYMVLHSLFLTASNFFYIKTLLTLTHFVTYFGFGSCTIGFFYFNI